MNPPVSTPARPRSVLAWLDVIFAAAVAPVVCCQIARIFFRQPINYNEGWNVMFVSRLLSGGPLYGPIDHLPLTPMNYPPLSFFIVGALSRATGDILLTGRLITVFSSAIVAVMIFRAVAKITGAKPAGFFAALFWYALMAGFAPGRLVMYDPQMLAHVFSVAALWLFTEWRDALIWRRIWLLALLCCLGVFTKHLIVAVPLAIAAALLMEDRSAFRRFAVAASTVGAAMAAAWFWYGGAHLTANLIDSGRQVLNHRLVVRLTRIFVYRGLIVVFAPFLLLLRQPGKLWRPYIIYFVVSFVIAAYASRGVGVDINAWFDFFIASAILFGIAAVVVAGSETRGLLASLVTVYGIATCALPVAFLAFGVGVKRLNHSFELSAEQIAYERQVEVLRSLHGPAVSESLLLAYDAGKEFLLEPFNAAQLIAVGRIPESILTDPIRRREFAAIVLEADLQAALCGARWLEV
ncbi:MAG TPA: hypothetical protein VHL99_07450, partial [Candidatus Binatia bacterium]|nr:hypothetical protein [Candidatus Binatia bacterium]